jgi:PAS domain S-box-containing protein
MKRFADRLRNLPIQTKMMVILQVTCGTVLILACVALFAFQMITIRQNFTRDFMALGNVMAHNSAAAAAFDQKENAEEVLASLKGHPDIQGACLVLENGKHLATFDLHNEHDLALEAAFREGLQTIGDHLLLACPVRVDDKVIATLYLRADLGSLRNDLLKLYAGVFGLILLVALAIAFVLSRKLQPIITGPILRLAKTAQEISKRGDYSIRAERGGLDEIGLLTDAFNGMLEKVQAQDALHHEIAERKRSEAALRESEQRFRSVAESATDSIIVTDENFRILSWNQAAKTTFGYEAGEVTGETLTRLLASVVVANGSETDGTTTQLSEQISSAIGHTVELIGRRKHGEKFPLEISLATWRNDHGTFFSAIVRDITERKDAEEALHVSQQRLLETSRRAGMAEVATGVLHNVGNILNSVNISASVIAEKVQRSVGSNFSKVATLFRERAGDLSEFLSNDERGKRIPAFVEKLANAFAEERKSLLEELELLNKNVVHIKDVVAMQQSYARVSGVTETLQMSALVDDALEMNTAALGRHNVKIVREFAPAPDLQMDKHKVLQILVNLIRNAKHAMDAVDHERKTLTLAVQATPQDTVRVIVKDNGIGIPPENLTSIFSHGFTTKKDGHGFGLHTSANAAKEMGGTLIGASDGIGHGATFTLEIPIRANSATSRSGIREPRPARTTSSLANEERSTSDVPSILG